MEVGNFSEEHDCVQCVSIYVLKLTINFHQYRHYFIFIIIKNNKNMDETNKKIVHESPRDKIFRMMKEDIFVCFGIDDDEICQDNETM